MNIPSHGIILAAGFGKRMLPITRTIPKPLVEVGGKAMIDYALEKLEGVGVRTCVVNLHYLGDQIEKRLSQRSGLQICFSDERDGLLDTGGGILKALPLLGDDPFYLLNSDSTWIEGVRPNLLHLAHLWQSDVMDGLLLLSQTVHNVGYDGPGDFHMDPYGRLTRRLEKEICPFAYAGAGILHPRLFREAPTGSFSLNLLFDQAIEIDRLYGVRMEGFWLHVGEPSSIEHANRYIHKN